MRPHPKIEDFDDPNDYADAVASWLAEHRDEVKKGQRRLFWSKLWNWAYSWGYIFVWAQICIYERLTMQEVSCPKCWKCTLSRWIMVSLIAGASYLLLL